MCCAHFSEDYCPHNTTAKALFSFFCSVSDPITTVCYSHNVGMFIEPNQAMATTYLNEREQLLAKISSLDEKIKIYEKQ